jgi:hypothetical protein
VEWRLPIHFKPVQLSVGAVGVEQLVVAAVLGDLSAAHHVARAVSGASQTS